MLGLKLCLVRLHRFFDGSSNCVGVEGVRLRLGITTYRRCFGYRVHRLIAWIWNLLLLHTHSTQHAAEIGDQYKKLMPKPQGAQ